MDRQNIRITVVDSERYGGDWPPSDTGGFMAWIEEKLAEIPSEYMDSARIQFGSGMSYGDDIATVEITYTRPETDEEVVERDSAMRLRLESDERWARERLANIERQRAALK